MREIRGERDTKRDRRIRLGSGDFVPAGANSHAQWLFLQAVERCVPEALEALGELVKELESTAPYPYSDSLLEWASRWGFRDGWTLRQARRTIEFWRDHPTFIGHWGAFAAAYFEPDFPRAPSWEPTVETEAEYLVRHRAYLDGIRSTPGITETPEKRSGEQHFEWLALHLSAGWTLERIATRYQDQDGNPNVPAVSKAISETAGLAGLTLRPARGRKLPQRIRS